ncbi:right-handed parallel beta-helix repeat-containing protein [Lacipirellula sp.]|uniref:right-handed parallel beta-helix repeat-containing protein n=1 Tax=Lacipirellula sp. TaxID=2691419 RepID=UPI003D0BF9F2
MRRGRWLEVCWYGTLAALAAASQIQLARGAEFFVAPGGNNSASGASGAPWATLQYAADRVGPGDRVTVRAGNYKGFYLDTSGTAASPIEFLAEPGVLINTPTSGAGNQDGINLELASHIIIDGFSVTGMPRAGIRSVGLDDDMAEFVTIRNVHAYNNGRWGIFTGHVNDLLIENNETSGSILEHGIYVSNSGDRPVIRNNVTWGNHGAGIHMNGDASLGGDGLITGALVSGNRVYGNAASINGGALGGGSGINMDGVQDSRVENNLLYDNHASGISLFMGDGAEGSSGNVVVNNTINQPSNGRWAINIQDGSTNNTLLNNIILSQHASRGAIDVSANSLPGMVSDYNAVISRFTTNGGGSNITLAQWQAATGQDAHSFTATAAQLFENWTAGDYRLRSGSPALNKGTATEAPAVDIVGTPRPAGAIDIGAYETATAPILSADFTGDGFVDAADLAAWRSAFGTNANGDANNDNRTDGADFLIWQREYTGSAPIASAVPEPTSAAAACVALVAIILKRRPK